MFLSVVVVVVVIVVVVVVVVVVVNVAVLVTPLLLLPIICSIRENVVNVEMVEESLINRSRSKPPCRRGHVINQCPNVKGKQQMILPLSLPILRTRSPPCLVHWT